MPIRDKRRLTLASLGDIELTQPVDDFDTIVWDEDLEKWVNYPNYQLAEANPTGLFDGGELNIGPGPNDIEIIAGGGIIVDSYTNPQDRPVIVALSWPQINEPITLIPSGEDRAAYFMIAKDPGDAAGPIPDTTLGILKQYTSTPSVSTGKDEIFLGYAIHDGTVWGEVSSPFVINNAAHTLEEYLNGVAGPTFRIDGGTISEGVGAAHTLDQAAGTLWEHNRNWHVDKKDPNREPIPAVTGLTFQYVNRDMSYIGTDINVIDVTQWDNGGTVEPIGGGAQRSTVQRVYIDPRDNVWILWGQNVYPNFADAFARINSETVVVPKLLKGSVWVGSIVSSRNDVDWGTTSVFTRSPEGGVGGGGGPVTLFTGLTDTPGSYTGEARKVEAVNDLETALEHQYRLRFVPYVDANTYYPQEVVFQDGWQMVANTITTDYPAPQNIGSPTWSLPDVPGFSQFQDESVIFSGHLYTFNSIGYFNGLRVWVPELSATTNYRFVIIRNPNGANPIYTVIEEPVLNENDWTILAASRVLVGAGEELLVYIDALDSGSDVTWAYNWERDTNSQGEGGFPPSGMWNTDNGESILRINWLDAEAIPVDHQLELQVIPGTTFEISEVGDPSRFVHYSVIGAYIEDGGNQYTRYPINHITDGGGGPRVGEPCQIRAVQPIAQPTKFVGVDAYWGPGTLPIWAGIQSFLQFDGVPQPVAGDEAYGVDILFQPIGKSDDWDVFGFDG